MAKLLAQIAEAKIKGYMSVLNLAELYCILARKCRKIAYEKQRNLRSFGGRMVSGEESNSNSDAFMIWKEAALLMASNPLSLVDAFAPTTAKILTSTLVTGSDSEFARAMNGVRGQRESVKCYVTTTATIWSFFVIFTCRVFTQQRLSIIPWFLF